MTPTTKFQLAQMVRCVDGCHRGRVGFVLAVGEFSISVKVFERATSKSFELEQQAVDLWEVIPEDSNEVANRLAIWSQIDHLHLEQQGAVQG